MLFGGGQVPMSTKPLIFYSCIEEIAHHFLAELLSSLLCKVHTFTDLPSCWKGIVCGLIQFNVCAHIYIVVEQPLLVNYRVN